MTFFVDQVVNATGYQSLIPKAFDDLLPARAEVYYQVCLGLEYVDTRPSERPISRIIMDGWFPCLMPMITNNEQRQTMYVATHGLHTMVASCRRLVDAEEILRGLTDTFVKTKVKEPTEREMIRFWPEFHGKFRYVGWKGVVQAKLKTRTEFRSSVTFGHDGVIYVFPGKISNVFDAYDEIKILLAGSRCIEKNGVCYPSNGVLAK